MSSKGDQMQSNAIHDMRTHSATCICVYTHCHYSHTCTLSTYLFAHCVQNYENQYGKGVGEQSPVAASSCVLS